MENKNRGGNLRMDDIMKMNKNSILSGRMSYVQICDGIEEKIGNNYDRAEFLTEFKKKFE